MGRYTSRAVPKSNLSLNIFHPEHEFEQHEKTNAKSCTCDGLIPCNGTGWGLACWVVALQKRTCSSDGQYAKHESAVCSMGCTKKCIASRSQKVIITLHHSLDCIWNKILGSQHRAYIDKLQ